MKVFLSFSGMRSHSVAEAFKEWIPRVLQSVEPYISSQDIEKGARWGEEITNELEACNFGIIFVTSDNMAAQWLHFEAGALSKSIAKARVVPFLFDVAQSQLSGPLTMFQATNNSRNDIWHLMKTINANCARPLDDAALSDAFEAFWPRLETKLEQVTTDPSLQLKLLPAPIDEATLLNEVVEMSRSQQRMLSQIRDDQRLIYTRLKAQRIEEMDRTIRMDRELAMQESRSNDSREVIATFRSVDGFNSWARSIANESSTPDEFRAFLSEMEGMFRPYSGEDRRYHFTVFLNSDGNYGIGVSRGVPGSLS